MNKRGKFVPVMLTPFKTDRTIDYTALSRLTEFYIETGATALFANCLSSEMFELTEEERISITAHVVEAAGNAVPVFSTGTFGGTIPEQADFCKRIADTGVEAVVAISSILQQESEPASVLNERMQELFALTGNIRFGLYECPVPYKRVLSAPELASLSSGGRISYYKDTSLDIQSIREKLAATAGYPAFELYDAYMVNAVASLKAGCAGLSCIQGNFVPELITWITCNFYKEDLQAEVAAAQQFLNDTMDVMHDVYPTVSKYFLQKRGLPIELTTRREVGVLTPAIKQSAEALLDRYKEFREKTGIGSRVVAS